MEYFSHPCWFTVWSVIRWDMNVEQTRQICCAAREIVFAGLNSYRCHTQLYARLWKYLSSYIKLVDLCLWILFMCYQKMIASSLVISRDEETFETTAAMLSRGRGPIPWCGRSYYFTLFDIIWSNVTEFINSIISHSPVGKKLKLNKFWDLLSSGSVCSIKR